MTTHGSNVFACIRLQKGLHDKGYEEWVAEMIGMREILVNFANLTKSDIVGMRAPFLKPGRNTQYEVSILRYKYNYRDSIFFFCSIFRHIYIY